MKVWEYKVFFTFCADTGEIEANLNIEGENGWECFNVVTVNPGSIVFYFKRPKENDTSKIS